jgi:SAM-dependent methyltransferase
MEYENNKSSIKYYVKNYILDNAKSLAGKLVVDFPAGNGVSSKILKEAGAIPIPFDIFPEYFQQNGIECRKADITSGIPLDSKSVDYVICQEGIEHFPDQLNAIREFNRILKNDGKLLITTPNHSNLRSKLSYLLFESERVPSFMPPNELDSIWMSSKEGNNEIYFGHIFLIGVQKLRVLATISGFELVKQYKTKPKSTSMLLLPFIFPYVYIFSHLTYKRNLKNNKSYDLRIAKKVYKEMFNLSINLITLTHSHIMMEFKKVKESNLVGKSFVNQHKTFGTT